MPYTTTTLERDLALELGIPMYGADPRHFPLGTKTGCRRTFEEAGVEYPVGYEDLRSKDDIVAALASLRGRRAGATSAMVKLNEGVAGAGNAVVDLVGLPAPGATDEARALLDRIERMELEGRTVTHETYFAKFAERGGIVEERITGSEVLSPSVQLRVTPLGEVQVLSTHDQVLGGPTGQSYLAARSPRRVTTPGRSPSRPSWSVRAWPSWASSAASRSTSSSSATAPGGGRTRSRSICARAGRRTRS